MYVHGSNKNVEYKKPDHNFYKGIVIDNLDPKKKYTKENVLKNYKKIMKKIHPDVSPELNRLASIVNEAKEIVIKNLN